MNADFSAASTRKTATLALPLRGPWRSAYRIRQGRGWRRSHARLIVGAQTLAPEAPVHIFSVGTGVLCQDGATFFGLMPCGKPRGFLKRHAMGVDPAYHVFFYESRTVTGNPNPTVDGTYRTMIHAGAITMRINL